MGRKEVIKDKVYCQSKVRDEVESEDLKKRGGGAGEHETK